MKKIIECAVCHIPYRKSRMYKVRLTRLIPNTVMAQPEEKVLICPACNRKAGFRYRKEDFKEVKDG